MKQVTSSRRQLVMATLLGLAILGALMRYLAADPSLGRDIGTLLLVLWLPAVGNLIGFLARQWHERGHRRMTSFDPARPFVPHLIVRVSPAPPQPAPAGPGSRDDCSCTVVVGHEGFRARAARPLPEVLARGGAPQELELEMLRPDLALLRLVPGTAFQVLAGRVVVAHGAVLGDA